MRRQLQRKRNIFRLRVCSLSYPACNTHAPYCQLWPAHLYNTFPYSLTNGMKFEKSYYIWNYVLIFSSTFVCNNVHSKKNEARCDNKCMLSSNKVSRYSCHILMILHFSTKIFEKYSNIKLHENQSNGNRVVPYGRTNGRTARQTDIHDGANSRFSQFWKLIWKQHKIFPVVLYENETLSFTLRKERGLGVFGNRVHRNYLELKGKKEKEAR